MTNQTWNAVDNYIVANLIADDPVLDGVLARNAEEGLPAIDVSPAQGKLLNLLVRMAGAKRVLEIGTLGAYSTIWMARALPAGGRAVTLEFNPHHAEVARANIESARLGDVIEVRVGAALDTLPGLAADGAGPFDFIFIDADKPNNPGYIDWALKLSRPGTVIVCDNVIRNGVVVDEGSTDANVRGARAAFEILGRDPRVAATSMQTVGSKGYDGFILAVVG